jgi:predicted ATPase
MLKKWKIENFKSFCGETDIELAPITIFVGSNSSGKSTIIQSILLLKQTLQYAPPNRGIALNGPLVKLGRFDDVRNAHGDQRHIGIGWRVTELSRYRASTQSHLYYGPYQVTDVECQIRFDASEPTVISADIQGAESSVKQLQLQPSIQSIEFSGSFRQTSDVNQPRILTLDLSRRKGLPAQEAEKGIGLDLPFDIVSIDDITTRQLLESKPGGELTGASVRHFLPSQLGIKYDPAKESARRLFEMIATQGGFRYWNYREENFIVPKSIVEGILKIFREVAGRPGVGYAFRKQNIVWEIEPDDMAQSTLLDHVSRIRRALGSQRFEEALRGILAKQTDFEQRLVKALPRKTVEDFTIPAPLPDAIERCSNFFTSSIRYLGPLRDEPKPVYPLEALVNTTDVGYRGEYTAAVLDLHRDRPVSYIPSTAIGKLPTVEPVTATLHDAVVDWLSYLGVAREVSTDDLGKMGHELQVQLEGTSRKHDLTNVGVGVSQVLPILVSALLARAPSLLIFEQPELHLHPRVQARLADFFLSLAAIQKQCIVETHSEYLVERLRRRAAEADDEKVADLFGIFFTEKTGGKTSIRSVVVNRYGAIQDWPKDFFDTSHLETQHIITAAQQKLKRERARDRPSK